jgi:hypothetical protein
MSALPAITADEIEPYDLRVKSDLDHIKLVNNYEVMARICHAKSLFYVITDPPLSLSCARDKIAEIPCLKSVYVPNFQFNLIGDYDVEEEFLVHKICITCDELSCLVEDKFLHMLDHVDMTSGIGIEFLQNSLHDCFFKHVVACNFDSMKFYSPILG